MATIRFNVKAKRFINEKGVFISEDFVLNSLDGHRAGVIKKVSELFLTIEEKNNNQPLSTITGDNDTILKQIASEVRYLTTVEYVVGKGGVNNIDVEDVNAINNILKNELTLAWGNDGTSYGLREVFNQYEAGEISYAQLKARTLAYVRGTRKAYWQGRDKLNDPASFPYMSRQLHGDDHCAECIKYADAGYQKVGDLPLPGQLCSCRSNCNCTVTYHSEKAYQKWYKSQLNKFSESVVGA